VNTTKLLFVDDEVQVLEGLRRTITPKKPEWHMDFVTSAEHALQKMETQEPDVIITDMVMTGMQGNDLISCIQAHHPLIRIIVLTGHNGMEEKRMLDERGIPCLWKPVSSEILIQSIENKLIEYGTGERGHEESNKHSIFDGEMPIERVLVKILNSLIYAGILEATELPDEVLKKLAQESLGVNVSEDYEAANQFQGIKSSSGSSFVHSIPKRNPSVSSSKSWLDYLPEF